MVHYYDPLSLRSPAAINSSSIYRVHTSFLCLSLGYFSFAAGFSSLVGSSLLCDLMKVDSLCFYYLTV